jgi:hypothetical protein
MIEVIVHEPVVSSATAEQALADVLSEIIIPAIEWPVETVAELTSAERIAAGRAPEDYPSGTLSAPPMPFWPGTYDPCEFADDAVWFEPLEPAWAPQNAYAPAWYSPWGQVIPTTVTVPTTDMDLPGWISMADADQPPHQTKTTTDWPAEPPHFYAPLPELSMDEFAGWPEPNPPDDMIE